MMLTNKQKLVADKSMLQNETWFRGIFSFEVTQMRTFEVEPHLSEVASGFNVLLYENGLLVDIQFRREEGTAEEVGEEWVKP